MKNTKAFILIGLLILGNIIFPLIFIDKQFNTVVTIIRTLISFIAFLIIFNAKDLNIFNKKNVEIYKSVFMMSLIYIITYYSMGIYFDFLKTPYSHTVIGILKNLLYIFSIVIFQEFIRSYFVKSYKKNKSLYVVIVIFFVLINIDWLNISTNFVNGENTFKYTSSYLLPEISKSVLFTYLVFVSGPMASVLYRGLFTLCSLLIPVVPDLDWFFSGIFDMLMCFITYLIVNFEIANKDEKKPKRIIKKQSPIKSIPFIIILIILILFVTGNMNYMPIGILSNSMYPTFSKGDIVVVKKVKEENLVDLEIGDMIQYQLNNRYIIHRIVQIVDKENYIYVTKGDNNNANDFKLVQANQIFGVVKSIVPFLGWPSVIFSEILSIKPPETIQIGKINSY